MNIPDTAALQQELQQIADARVSQIATEAEYHATGERLRGIKALHDRIEVDFKDPLVKAREALDSLRALKNSLLDPLERERLILVTARAIYENEDERRRNLLNEKVKQVVPEISASLGIPVTSLTPDLPKLTKSPGISSSKLYRARVTDKKKLIKAVADGIAPEGCLVESLPFLNKLAVANKTALSIPGVEVYVKKSTGVRK